MSEPTDDGSLPPQERDRLPLWPLLYCVTPILLGIGLVLLVNQPGDDPPANAPANRAAAIPDLGAGGLHHGPSGNAAEDDGEATPGAPDEPDRRTEETEEPEAQEASEREIDIHLKNLAFAASRQFPRGILLEQQWLEQAQPRERVHERIRAAMKGEPDARARLELFRAFHDEAAELACAKAAWESRPTRFTDGSVEYAPGEIQELAAYARALVRASPPDDAAAALLRQVLANAGPEWFFADVLPSLESRVLAQDDAAMAEALAPELEAAMANQVLPPEVRGRIFRVRAVALRDQSEGLGLMTGSPWQGHLPDWIDLIAPVYGAADQASAAPAVARRLGEPLAPVLDACRLALANAEADEAATTRLVDALGRSGLPGVREMIENGIAQGGERAGDYFAALGRLANARSDLDRLENAALGDDAGAARGAVEGLRFCGMSGADAALKRVLEMGENAAVRSLALGALLERNPYRRDDLVAEYLSSDQPAALRAIAVSHLRDDEIDALKQIVEDDKSLQVRQAALLRLGALKDPKLKSFFRGVANHDPSPVLRQIARSYADELEPREDG